MLAIVVDGNIDSYMRAYSYFETQFRVDIKQKSSAKKLLR